MEYIQWQLLCCEDYLTVFNDLCVCVCLITSVCVYVFNNLYLCVCLLVSICENRCWVSHCPPSIHCSC